MNEILEYRKASAEVLGFDFYKNPKLSEPFFVLIDNGEETSSPVTWQPDTDLNQMGMIEDWLIEQGCSFIIESPYKQRKEWYIKIYGYKSAIPQGVKKDKSKPIAFMKAFMEYIKTK